MKQHTKEPWEVDHYKVEGIRCYELVDANEKTIVDTVNSEVAEIHEESDEHGTDRWDEQGRVDILRIKACVNACQGIANPNNFAELLVQLDVLLDDLNFANTNGLHHLCWSAIMANAGNIKEHLDQLGVDK